MRRPEADLLTKERTVAIMALLKQLKIKRDVIAADLGVKPHATWCWANNKARGPKKLEEYLTKREAEEII